MLQNKKVGQAKWFLAVLVLLLTVSMLSGCGKKAADTKTTASPTASVPAVADTVVQATYKGGQVTQGELQKFINVTVFLNPDQAQSVDIPEFKEYMLNQMVILRVLNARASDASKTAAEAKVKQQMDVPKAYTGTEKTTLDTNLKAANITLADIEDYFRANFVALVDIQSKVTDQQIQEAYDAKIKADPQVYVSGTVDHILISIKDLTDQTGQKNLRTDAEALAIAKDVKSQLDKGGDFAALAKQYSDDTGSKENGGNLGNALFSQYDPAFKKAALELPIGQISDPVLSSFGYHLIKVESRTTGTLADEKEAIRGEVSNKLYGDFVKNEFPAYNYKSNLPTPVPAPAATPDPAVSSTPAASSTPVESVSAK